MSIEQGTVLYVDGEEYVVTNKPVWGREGDEHVAYLRVTKKVDVNVDADAGGRRPKSKSTAGGQR